MSHKVTASKKQFRRLSSTFGGMLVAALLFVGGTYLLYWNEKLSVTVWETLEEARLSAELSVAIDPSSVSDNDAMIWALRIVGVLLIFSALKRFILSLALSGAVPVGAIRRSEISTAAFILGLALSIVTVAAAWMRVNPLFGGALIALAVALTGIVYEKGCEKDVKRKRRKLF
ncbi:hypothetical protein AGMMS50276_13930 [Synergistales bacterium]|nr:hypothetical protein AGMMS50276_13930 [Synergistales bacterium]